MPNSDSTNRKVEYPVDNSARELHRLMRQAVLLDPLTRPFLREAGLRTGMRVLDVGSGAGDVAFLAADIVGPTGRVIGVDRSASAVAIARTRAEAAGLSHVRFLQADPAERAFDEPFDAVVGRLVLMYYPDPVEALRRLVTHLRPGGLVAVQEADYHGRWSTPPARSYDQCMRWIRDVLTAVGAHTDLGFRLYSVFSDAGLDAPRLSACASVGGGPDFEGYGIVAEIVRGMLPNLERFGIATAEQVGMASLEARMRDEVVASGGVVVVATLVGAWARAPR